MPTEAQRVDATREHLSWCYRFALFWLALALVVFGGAYPLADGEQFPDSNRILMFIMLATIIVTTAIWQAHWPRFSSPRKLDPPPHEQPSIGMTEIWALAALWLGLALVATLFRYGFASRPPCRKSWLAQSPSL